MARETAVEARFRERIRQEREHRQWSQATLADKLGEGGISGVYPTTVAKIESGERAVRIDEAAVLADLFDTSVDALMGRTPGSQPSELEFQLRTLRDTARQYVPEVFSASEVVRELLSDLPATFEQAHLLNRVGREASIRLGRAYAALSSLADLSHELVLRQQGRGELSDKELKRLDVPKTSTRKEPERPLLLQGAEKLTDSRAVGRAQR